MSDTTNYRKAELGNITGSGGQIKVKFVNAEGETKWLSITSDEFAAIECVLTAEQPPTEITVYVTSTDKLFAQNGLLWENREAAEDSGDDLKVFEVVARIDWTTVEEVK